MEQFYNNVKTKIKTEKQKVKKINDELNDIMSDRFKLCDRENELRNQLEKVWYFSNANRLEEYHLSIKELKRINRYLSYIFIAMIFVVDGIIPLTIVMLSIILISIKIDNINSKINEINEMKNKNKYIREHNDCIVNELSNIANKKHEYDKRISVLENEKKELLIKIDLLESKKYLCERKDYTYSTNEEVKILTFKKE